MVWNIVENVFLGFCGYSLLSTVVGSGIGGEHLGGKSNEEIYAMKNWKDASKLRKTIYVLCPPYYWRIKEEKQRRKRLEEEVKKKYHINSPGSRQ